MARPFPHDLAAMGRLARMRFAAALMSDTKWRKLIAAVKEASPNVSEMTLKFVDTDEPRQMKFPPSLACPRAYIDTIELGPVELRAIEWMELAMVLEPVLRPVGRFPVETINGHSRIVGYH